MAATTGRRPSRPDLEFGEWDAPAARKPLSVRPEAPGKQRDSWQDLFSPPGEGAPAQNDPAAHAPEELDPLQEATEVIDGLPLLEGTHTQPHAPAETVEQHSASHPGWLDPLSADGDLFGESPSREYHAAALEAPAPALPPKPALKPAQRPRPTPTVAFGSVPMQTAPAASPSATLPHRVAMVPKLERSASASKLERALGPKTATAPIESEHPTGHPPPLAPASAPESDRPTRLAPKDKTRSYRASVPRSPRMPTLGPELDLSNGMEQEVTPARGSPPSNPSIELDLSGPTLGGPTAPKKPRASYSVPPAAPVEHDNTAELRDRFALGDYSGVLVLAESLAPKQLTAELRRCIDESRNNLQQMYLSRLGSLRQRPTLAITRAELKWLSLDHRAGFVLSLVDGMSSVEDILDLSNMPSLDALRILFELLTQRVIELRE